MVGSNSGGLDGIGRNGIRLDWVGLVCFVGSANSSVIESRGIDQSWIMKTKNNKKKHDKRWKLIIKIICPFGRTARMHSRGSQIVH